MNKKIKNITLKDINGTQIILTNKSKLYDAVNKFEIVANYDDAIDPVHAYQMVIDNILSGRLIAL